MSNAAISHQQFYHQINLLSGKLNMHGLIQTHTHTHTPIQFIISMA